MIYLFLLLPFVLVGAALWTLMLVLFMDALVHACRTSKES